jgi:hypothetical protein
LESEKLKVGYIHNHGKGKKSKQGHGKKIALSIKMNQIIE